LVFYGLSSESSAWIDRALGTKGKISPAIWAKTINTSSLIKIAHGDFTEDAHLAHQAHSLSCDINEVETCAWASLFISISSMVTDTHKK
jgi:hypothetical protein